MDLLFAIITHLSSMSLLRSTVIGPGCTVALHYTTAGLDASTADLMDLLRHHMAQAQQELRELEGQRAALLADAEAQMAQVWLMLTCATHT
jgi:hypothetical protein